MTVFVGVLGKLSDAQAEKQVSPLAVAGAPDFGRNDNFCGDCWED
jgi:hypothetical protein